MMYEKSKNLKLYDKSSKKSSNRKVKAVLVLSVLLTGFVIFSTNSFMKVTPRIVSFKTNLDANQARTGRNITFSLEFLGNPSNIVLIYGDGNIESIEDATTVGTSHNAIYSATFFHSYQLQGKYTPKILVFYHEFVHIRKVTRETNLLIQNDAPQFDILIESNNSTYDILNISDSREIFEGDEVNISITNLEEDFTFHDILFEFPDSQISTRELSIKKSFDISGKYPISQFPISISVIGSCGELTRRTFQINVRNKAPEAYFELSKTSFDVGEIVKISAEKCVDTKNDLDILFYYVDWGDAQISYGKNVEHAYSKPGLYTITLHVRDDDCPLTDSYSKEITITRKDVTFEDFDPIEDAKPTPTINIDYFNPTEIEGRKVQFTSTISNIENYSINWDFGDGSSSTEASPKHAWFHAGSYNINLTITDKYGHDFYDLKTITIQEQPPQIIGPLVFNAVEDRVVELNVEVSDSLADDSRLRFRWFDSNGELISVKRKPILMLKAGNHEYMLEVIDFSGASSLEKISVIVHPLAPEVFISDYMYHGASGGEIDVTAYGYDTGEDFEHLQFIWRVFEGDSTSEIKHLRGASTSTITLTCSKTTMYTGEVTIIDPGGKSKTSIFRVISRLNDEEEIDQNTECECLKVASENDLDSDNDGLPDDFELAGYNITINYFEGSSTFTVNSSPFLNDTDGDGLLDNDEYLLGSHPRNVDSDNDELLDFEDPEPAEYDKDQDGLSDFYELYYGTNVNVSDTDGDGLSDGAEINGWGDNFFSNPLSPDSDKDFLSDGAEIMNYLVKNKDEYEEDKRTSLNNNTLDLDDQKFQFNTAAAAELRFSLTFSEFSENISGGYGVSDENIPNLNVTVYHATEGVLLFNGTTNRQRYYSQAIDITSVLNNDAYSYRGLYVINSNDSLVECSLEQYEVEICRYLDPNDPDFDADGILDGVETNLLIKGRDVIDFKELCQYNNLTMTEQSNRIYPATFNFANETVGTTGTNIAFIDAAEANCVNEIITGIGGHANVLKTYNTPTVIQGWVHQVNGPISGTIEFWIMVDLNTNPIWQHFFDEAGNDGITLSYESSGIEYFDGRSFVPICSINENEWIHVRIDYDFNDDWHIWVNGQQKDSKGFCFRGNPMGKMDRLIIDTWIDNIAYFDAIGYSWDPNYTIGDNFHPYNPIPIVPNRYYLEIPQIGSIENAQLSFTIDSEGTPIGGGCVYIDLIKEENNRSIGDVLLLEIFDEFNDLVPYQYENTINLKYFLEKSDISDIQGTYRLEVLVLGDLTDNFTLSAFYVDYDTFIKASEMDMDAWLTDPALPDSDYDGWLDGYEIFTTKSNPTQKDSDGDLIWDPIDRDCLGDVILEIQPYYAAYTGSPTPSLQLAWNFTGDAVDDAGGQCPEKTTTRWDLQWEEPPWPSFYHAYFNEYQYFFDINDDLTSASNTIVFDFKLLHIIDNQSVQIDLFENFVYIIGTVESFQQFNTDEKFIYSFKLCTRTVERANTIAIYEENSTSFVGRYPEKEKFNIVRLKVTNEGLNGTPFNEGINSIIIPTRLFTETLLNGYIQNEKLDEIPLWSDINGEFDFISVDRDGEYSDACGIIDFLFIRNNISGFEAMEILALLITCVVNQSLDENNKTITTNATIYTYISTKIDGINAVQMNLPVPVLRFITWANTSYISSELGQAYDVYEEPDLYVIETPTVEEQVDYLNFNFMGFLGFLIWLIVRTVLLVLIFILLAIEIISIIPMFIALFLLLPLFGGLIKPTSKWGINGFSPYGVDTKVGYIDLLIGANSIAFCAWIKWIYWPFFDLYIPLMTMDSRTSDFLDTVEQAAEDPPGMGTFLSCGIEQVGDTSQYDFHTIYWDTPFNDPPQFVNLTLYSPAGNSYEYEMEIAPVGYKSIDYWEGKEDVYTGETYTFDKDENSFMPANWYRGVRFNITIDFENNFSENERSGQWYYQFHAKADRTCAFEFRWPWLCNYAAGPFFNDTGDTTDESEVTYLQWSELNPYSGKSTQEFNFSVWWADYENNMSPTKVYLVLELPNGTIATYDMYNASWYQVDYSRVSNYGNVTFTEYKCIANLSQYVSEELELFHHYFRALLPNGETTTLFDTQYVDEFGNLLVPEDELDYYNATKIDVWFEGPLVFPVSMGGPEIREWHVEDLTNNRLIENFGLLNPVWEEDEIVFWVYIHDPDRQEDHSKKPDCYAEGEPRLVLTNTQLNYSNSIVYENLTWAGYDWTYDADKYWVKIYAGDLGPGSWDFEFHVNDSHAISASLTTDITPSLWIVGSLNQIFLSLQSSLTLFGYMPIMSFIGLAGIAAMGGTHVKIAATALTIGLEVVELALMLTSISSLTHENNTGGLIGLAWALTSIGLCMNYGLSFGELDNIMNIGARIIDLAKLWLALQFIFYAASGLTYALSEIAVLSGLLFYMGDIFGLMSMSIVLGMTLDMGTDLKIINGVSSSNPMTKSIEYYSYAMMFIGLLAFVSALEKSGIFKLYK